MGKIKSLAAAGAGAAVLAVGWHYVYGAGSGQPSNGFGIADDPSRLSATLTVDTYNSKRVNVEGFLTYSPGAENNPIPFHHLPWKKTIKVSDGTTVVLAASDDDRDALLWCRITPGSGAAPQQPVAKSGYGTCSVTAFITKAAGA